MGAARTAPSAPRGGGNDQLYGNDGLDKLNGEGGNASSTSAARLPPTPTSATAARELTASKDSLDQTPGVETVLA